MRKRWRHVLPLVGLIVALGHFGCKDENGGGSAKDRTWPVPSTDATCQRDEAVSDGLLRITVIPKGTTHEFWKAIHAGAIKAEREYQDVQVIWDGPTKEDDREQQINVVENHVSRGVAGIVLAPLDDEALRGPVRDAAAAGIGVVIMDSGLNATICEDYASFVATDNYEGGRQGGDRLGQLLDGKGKVLMMRYQVGSASTAARERGFLDAMRENHPDIEIVSSDQYGGATTESAFAKGENLLNRFKDIDGIFTPNESTTFGMLRALQSSGRAGKVKFVGFDSSDKLIEALAAGELHGLVLQDPLNMGYRAVRTMVAYLRGEEVAQRVPTGSALATPENMDEERIRDLLSPPVHEYLK